MLITRRESGRREERRMERIAFLLIAIFHLVRGNYEVSVQLSYYSNSNHRHHNGRCCDLFSIGGCLGDCDNYFLVCFEGGEDDDVCCKNSGDLGSHDRIEFDSRVGKLTNPINFTVDGNWTEEMTVAVKVYDDDIFSSDDLIDVFIVTSPTDGQLDMRGSFNQASLSLSVSVSCSQGYYGEDCSVMCQPDPTFHWCDSDGGRVCVNGWSGEWCDVCTPSLHCSERGGYCEVPGQCLCRDGFTGPYCNPIMSSPSLPPSSSLTASSSSEYYYMVSLPVVLQPNKSSVISTTPTPSTTDVLSNTVTESSESHFITDDDTRHSTGQTVETVLPQPILRRNGGVADVVGGVLAGLATLITISIIITLGVWFCWKHRQKRKNKYTDDIRPLVRPLMGENPMYVDHAMGTHQSGREYHQFSNPLYDINTMPTRTDSPVYSYPVNRQSHLLSNVYLPGDASPLSSSLSLQQQAIDSPARRTSCLGNPGLEEEETRSEGVTINGDRGHRTISISDQYFHLPHH